jgi:hypothetical protein
LLIADGLSVWNSFSANPEARVDSVDKIDLLLSIFAQFRETLRQQIELIERDQFSAPRRKRST